MYKLLSLFIIFISITGCVTTMEIKKMDSLNSINYEEAAKYAEDRLVGGMLDKFSKNKDKSMYWALQAASARRNLEDYEKSNQWFEVAEKSYKKYNEENILHKIGGGAVSFLVNDKATDYKGEVYDGVMINTYKALNYLALGDKNKARVEFNRAIDRQRRAKKIFAQEIKQKNKELTKKKNIKKTINSKAVKDALKVHYSNLDSFKAYPNFVNPYTTYISGLFYALSGDIAKGTNQLKEAYGMTGNVVIKQDLLDIKNNDLNGYIWVIFENGMSVSKEEINIYLPLFLIDSNIMYSGISLPKLKFNSLAFNSISVKSNNKIVKTKKFADMDAVIVTEFKKDLPVIQARSIASAIAKTIMQRQINKNTDGMAGLFATIYQIATTGSDTRIWSALPKNFQVARVKVPTNGNLELKIGNKIKIINVGSIKNAIINIKIATNISKPVINLIKF